MRLRAGDWTGPACPPETAAAPVPAGPPHGPRHSERTEACSGARPDRRVSGPRRLSAGKTWEACLYVVQPREIRSKQATGRWCVQSPGRGPPADFSAKAQPQQLLPGRPSLHAPASGPGQPWVPNPLGPELQQWVLCCFRAGRQGHRLPWAPRRGAWGTGLRVSPRTAGTGEDARLLQPPFGHGPHPPAREPQAGPGSGAAVGWQDPGPGACPACGEAAPLAEGSCHGETQPCAACPRALQGLFTGVSETCCLLGPEPCPEQGSQRQSGRRPGTPASGDPFLVTLGPPDTQVGAGMARAAGPPQPQLVARQGGAGVKKGSRVPALPWDAPRPA